VVEVEEVIILEQHQEDQVEVGELLIILQFLFQEHLVIVHQQVHHKEIQEEMLIEVLQDQVVIKILQVEVVEQEELVQMEDQPLILV
jgi:hypothetical protein